MPNFGIGSVAIRISQTGTQEALIQNTGNSTLYLDQYSSVSSANHGLALAPLSSVNWAAGRELWAVCAPGTDTSVTVLYGATGTALSEVAAVVTGDVTATIDGPVNANITNASIPVTGTVNANVTNAVIPVNGTVNAVIQNASIPVTGNVNANITNANIDATITGNVVVNSGQVNVGGILTPVVVQGGGTNLFAQNGSLNAAGTQFFNIPSPVSGQTFYGYRVRVTISGAAHATATKILACEDSYGNITNVVTPPVTATSVGRTFEHLFTVPAQDSSYGITLTNQGTVALTYSIIVDGLNVAATTPSTNVGRLLFLANSISVTPPTAGSSVLVWIPPTFNTYTLLLRGASTASRVVGMGLSYVDSAGAVIQYVGRAYNLGNGNPNVDVTPGGGGSQDYIGAGNVYIPISPNGRSALITFGVAATNNGTFNLSLV